MIPRATLRLQLHGSFTFADAQAQLDYYAALGVSHLYLSPIFCARPGSMHGYDVTNMQRINPELGGDDAFYAFASAARAHGLGLILDIVPNHMAASPEHNAWWRDVLQHGQQSAFASFFDIDWNPPDRALCGKVLLPMLARPYPHALRQGVLQLAHDAAGEAGGAGEAVLHCHDVSLPLAPGSLGEWQDATSEARAAAFDPRTAEGQANLHALLERQHYRVAWWRTARDMLNWRRFFEVSELVGVRVEREAVFDAIHTLVFSLIKDGVIDGVRIDHVDGMADPAGYCRRLRAQLDALAPHGRPWIVVEKILADDEMLPTDWQVDGTTGYDAMNDLSAVLHDADGIERLRGLWDDRAGNQRSREAQIVTTRRTLVTQALVTEWRRATAALAVATQEHRDARDITAPALARALAELLAHLPIYRTYFTPDAETADARPEERRVLRQAAEAARGHLQRDDWVALAFIVDVIENTQGDLPDTCAAQRRVQQTMPPVAAKAIEDTLFYRDGALLSRNEVGTAPCAPALSPEAFIARIAARAHHFPHTMLATATHDHKRGEDTRMRLAVISEFPQLWRSHVARLEARRPTAPVDDTTAEPIEVDEGDRLMLYQALIGAWPLDLHDLHKQPEARDAFLDRIRAWQRKAIREAGRHGDWSHPDLAYEAAADAFLTALQEGGLDHIATFAQRISVAGALNTLAQTCLHLTLPGVPDRYQGTETWDFTLVDPDNRCAVDYGTLREGIEEIGGMAESDIWSERLAAWRDGRIKQRVIQALLEVRHAYADIFSHPDLALLPVDGPHARCVMAMVRGAGEHAAVIVVTRLAAGLLADCAVPHVPTSRWESTHLTLPSQVTHWRNCLSGDTFASGTCELQDLLKTLPIAVLLPAT